MNKPLKIALYADSYNERVGQGVAYLDFLSQFGEVILVSASNSPEFFLENCDVLALPGGADVDPQRYGEYPRYPMMRTNPHYEYLDKVLLTEWVKTDKPIIGICRGLQTLNVVLGGSLHQDIRGHVGGDDRESQVFEMYTDIEGYYYMKTNSYHHQSIKKLADGFEILGWSPVFKNCPSLSRPQDRAAYISKHHYKKSKEGVISKCKDSMGTVEEYFSTVEIIRHKTKPYIAFQYHPEEYNCELAVKLIQETLTEYEVQKRRQQLNILK